MFACGVCGIDIDGFDGDAEREARAKDILQLMDTYTEYSPSGKGYHLIFHCDITMLPKDYKAAFYQKNDKFGIECYFSGMTYRFFTYTGEAVNNCDLEDRTKEVLSFLDRYMKKPVPDALPSKPTQVMPAADDQTDAEYLEIGLKKDQKFIELWQGDRPHKNESRDDQGLINKLAYWCNGNEDLIQESFIRSPHYNSKNDSQVKKCDRVDYIPRTINRAITDLKATAREKHAIYQAKRDTVSPGRLHLVEQQPEAPKNEPNFVNPLTNSMRYTLDDIGTGYLFADAYKDISRYVPEAKSWYYYTGKVWRQDIEGLKVAQQGKDLADFLLKCAFEIQDLTQRTDFLKYVAKVTSNKGRKTMIEEARSVYPVGILEFDKDPYIFNCQNCTLDLKNFKMRPHRAGDMLSKISNVHFNKDAKCDRWENFINEIMNGDIQTARFLQKALGYSLTGDASRECFFILYGATTRNGKATTMETTLHLMGDYGKTAQPESIAQKQNPNSSNANEDIARLKGARFVNMSEPDKGLRLNSALVKQITGGDTVTARFLHQNSFEYRPEYKLFINTNHRPKISDDSIFNSGRVKLIPFERRFEDKEQDKGLKSFLKQPENISGIFNWFIEGLKALNAEGLEQSEAVTAATDEYRETSDTVGLFIKECMTECSNNYIKLQKVYSKYDQWCSENGYSPMNKRNLTEELKMKGVVKRHRTLGFVMSDYMFRVDFPFDTDE